MTVVNVLGFVANNIGRFWGYGFSGVPGYEDAVTVLIGVGGLAMLPYCQLKHGHTAVELFIEAAPFRLKVISYWLSKSLAVLTAMGLAIMLTYGTIQTWSDGIETPVLGWPVWIFMPSAVVSCFLWACAAMIESDARKHTEKGNLGGP